MADFTFSDRTLDELEGILGMQRAARGRVDRAGNRRFAQAIGGMASAPSKASRSKQAAQVINRLVSKAPQAIVKVTSRVRGSGNTLGAFLYVSRLGMPDQEVLPLETSEGRFLTRADDMMELARDWQNWEMADCARRKGATAISTVFSMPPGTDPHKVRDAVRSVAETEMGNNRWVMVLHTDEPHPHVHLIIANRDNDGRRFNPGRECLHRLRESFAENLRARGVAAHASQRMARGYPTKRESMPVRKIRDRGELPGADKRQLAMLLGVTGEGREQAIERDQARSKTIENAEMIRAVYVRAIAELEAYGAKGEASQAKALRSWVDGMPAPAPARAEIIERLKAGNALPEKYAKGRELDRPKPHSPLRGEHDATFRRERLEAVFVKLERSVAELGKDRQRDGPDKAPSATFDHLRDLTAALGNVVAAPSARHDQALEAARQRLLEGQRRLEIAIKEAPRDQDRERVRNRDLDIGGSPR